MRARSLFQTDERAGFESGDPAIDRFFREFAGQNQWRHHVGVTYCLFSGRLPVAFVTLSAGSLDPRDLPDGDGDRLPRHPAPVLRLARLGVGRRHQGDGLGRELLGAAADIALEMRARAGCIGIVVDAKPDAVAFYERHGFRALPITSRVAGAGAPPVRLFVDLRHLVHGAAAARAGLTVADSLAAEIRRRARELSLSPEEIRAAVDKLMG